MSIAQFLSYTLTRVRCVQCGTFEHGSQGACIASCPHCGSVLLLELACTGMTRNPLPFTTRPHVPGVVEPSKGKMPSGMTKGVGEWKSGGKKHNSKSTGRRKGGQGRSFRPGRGDAYGKYQYEGKFRGKDSGYD